MNEVTKLPLLGRRIMVVEDNYIIAFAMQAGLEKQGAIILGPAPSVRKALRLLDAELSVDAAVLDMNLGDENVFAVASALEARGIPFLFTTGYGAGDVPPAWLHVQRFEKPTEVADVVSALLGFGAP